MSRWTPDRSVLLSLLLDEVTGTQNAIEMRQDYCMIWECLTAKQVPWLPNKLSAKIHYTGSRAEGLDLPGSDDDYMKDINNQLGNIKVIQSPSLGATAISSATILFLRTENTNPGFALLQMKENYPLLESESEMVNGVRYLSSNLLVKCRFDFVSCMSDTLQLKRQGPSIEHQLLQGFEGIDNVLSIHCECWPNDAFEWRHRERLFGWPAPSTIASIVSFGCHLVPVGHPNSKTKLTEWRISFSWAERTLVWSFNHIQIQCYAVMKLILKEFIKKNCSQQNQVLCSYFIKTFLFWKFETTDRNFWREDNFRECFTYLIIKFADCLRDGVLPHYFISNFNLLSVKLTREAQRELLQLFDIVIHSDICIFKECDTLKTVWSKFITHVENAENSIQNIQRTIFLMTDELMAKHLFNINTIICRSKSLVFEPQSVIPARLRKLAEDVFPEIFVQSISFPVDRAIGQILALPCKTHLKTFTTKRMLLERKIISLTKSDIENRSLYRLQQIAHKQPSFDLSTSKLWYAMILLKKQDYILALSTINKLLSCIPPFAVNVRKSFCGETTDAKMLYVDIFMKSDSTITQRARKAWLMQLQFDKSVADVAPLAIQIELYFCDIAYSFFDVPVSTFVLIYYLAFQCYHELGQHDKRDNALRQLLDSLHTMYDYPPYFYYWYYHAYNIAGHCLIITGKRDQARDMFMKSNKIREAIPVNKPLRNCCAAKWYLQHFC